MRKYLTNGSLVLLLGVSACSRLLSPVAAPNARADAPVLSVKDVVDNRGNLAGAHIRVRGCLSLMCTGADCYAWLASDDLRSMQGPHPLPQIAVKNNANIQREMIRRQEKMQYPKVVIEGIFEDTLYPEGISVRNNIDPPDNSLLIGPITKVSTVKFIGDRCY